MSGQGGEVEQLNSKRLLPVFYIAAAAILLPDLVTKGIVYRSMELNGASIPVLGEWVRLTYIHNTGAAFSLFQGSRWFFVGVSLLSILVILALALSGRYPTKRVQAAFGLILGGALGNLIDRLWLGKVIDFLDMGVGRTRWPVFNVADIGVTVGVLLLLLALALDSRKEP
jgi:signal peptidase II